MQSLSTPPYSTCVLLMCDHAEADSALLMEHAETKGLYTDSTRLVLEYSISTLGPPSGATGAAGGNDSIATNQLDWICPMCTSVNFARRLECFQCMAVRPANPKRVTVDTDGPSPVLKV